MASSQLFPDRKYLVHDPLIIFIHRGPNKVLSFFGTIKLGYNDHGYSEFTAKRAIFVKLYNPK
jgi:hypothetical protein